MVGIFFMQVISGLEFNDWKGTFRYIGMTAVRSFKLRTTLLKIWKLSIKMKSESIEMPLAPLGYHPKFNLQNQ